MKKFSKWILIIFIIFIMVLLAPIVIINSPGLFLPESKHYRAITVYSEHPISFKTDSVMNEVFLRLDAVPIYNPKRKMNLTLCDTQEKFSFFSNFTLRDDRIMGFCLFGNAFVNIDFINELKIGTGGLPKYHTREGSVVHVATHELMHQYLADTIGEYGSRQLPTWKVEGYIEYAVNHFAASQDSGFSIAERIDIYLDDSQWNRISGAHRNHYLWGLMMEYLIIVKKMSLSQVMSESVIMDKIYQEMTVWKNQL